MNMIMTKKCDNCHLHNEISLGIVEDLDEEFQKVLSAFGFFICNLFYVTNKNQCEYV